VTGEGSGKGLKKGVLLQQDHHIRAVGEETNTASTRDKKLVRGGEKSKARRKKARNIESAQQSRKVKDRVHGPLSGSPILIGLGEACGEEMDHGPLLKARKA